MIMPRSTRRNRQIPKYITFGGASQEDVMAFINNLHRHATFVRLSDQYACDLLPRTRTPEFIGHIRSEWVCA